MLQRRFDKIEFYITNVCNLDCDGCNRFNDYNFRGWQRWDDYAHVYEQWAQHTKIIKPVILGGEPLLNPTINDWIRGVTKLWKQHDTYAIQVLTNGTRLTSVPGLYDTLLETRAWLSTSNHNSDQFELLVDEIDRFLGGVVKKTTGRENNPFAADYVFTGRKNIQIPVWDRDEFQPSALLRKPDNKITLHNNNPEHAHSNCTFVSSKCYHFIRGKLYKCGPVALFPEFDQQFNLDISDQDRVLLNSYKPLTMDDWDSYSTEFFENLDNVIPQCKFCPVNPVMKKIYPIIKTKHSL